MDINQINLLIVDDHKKFREALKLTLSRFDNINIVGECEDGIFVEDFLKKQEVDVILMDIQMKNLNGVETTRQVKRKFSKVQVIAFSNLDEEPIIEKLFRAGASAYLTKDNDPKIILDTILSLSEA